MKNTDIKRKIKEYFFHNPRAKQRVRQMERELQLPLPSVIRYAKELEKERILKISHIANITVYSADRASPQYLTEKKLFNIRQIYASGMMDYLIAELSNPTIVLFGSYSRGEDVEGSDIDLYIEAPAQKNLKLAKFENLLQRKIQVFMYKNIHSIEHKELANNIINGMVLNGFLEAFT